MKRVPVCLIAWSASLLICIATAEAQEPRIKWRGRPSVEVGAVRLDFKARIESDLHLATPQVGRDAEFLWQRPRVEVAGRILARTEFEVSREFGEGEGPAWKDAFVDVRLTRAVAITAGRFKVPFGRETLVARAHLDFIGRSLAASQLAPSRDTGIMVHGRVLGKRFGYELGYFGRDGDNARTQQAAGAHGTVALRLVGRPFADASDRAASTLQLGVALARSALDNRLGLRGQTLLEDGVFFDRVYVNGHRRRTGLEALWPLGPASIAGEYMVVSDDRLGMGFDRQDLPSVRARGWYVAGTWMVTGEKKDPRPEPRRKCGAVEVVARIDQLAFDAVSYPGTSFGFPNDAALAANSDTVSTVGLTWYLRRFVRVQYNQVFESIADRQRSPSPTNHGSFTTGTLRVQFVM